MQWYWRYKWRFAIYIEISKKLGIRPLFSKKRINQELIFEIPYGYAIITPQHKLLNERNATINRSICKKHGKKRDEKRNRGILGTLTGTSKS